MTSAPLAQQRLLIDLARLDADLARLSHERHDLPVLRRIEATVERLRRNRRDAAAAGAALDEARERAARCEQDVAQVTRRAQVLRERLHSGAAPARDLPAIQGEIDQLGRRQGVLEDAQLEALEDLETTQARLDDLAAQEAGIRAEGREMTAERDAAFERLDAERSRVQRSRDDLAARIDADLLAEYERVRAATGGLGAVALYGSRLEGGTVEIGPQELARIAAAPLHAVVHAEDNDVIVVRMEP